MRDREHIDFIDIAKGIGIILVVVGHCVNGELTSFIYLFHMPLFFVVSGYLMKDYPITEFKTYVFRKIKSLYIPYITSNIIFLLLHNIFFAIGFYKEGVLNLYPIPNRIGFIKDAIGILAMTHMEQIVAPSWYLRVLFVSSTVF